MMPVFVIEVTWKRRKGKPVEAVMLMTGGWLQAMFACVDIAQQLKVPKSWVMWRSWDKTKDAALQDKRKQLLEIKACPPTAP
jgi:hypothetical protein